MKRSILAAAMVMASATVIPTSVIPQAQQRTLTSLAVIHSLTNPEAAAQIPVEFEATVTYYRDYERTLFVQDGDTAIFVLATTGLKLMPGDRVVVRGNTQSSFRPIVVSNTIQRIGHGSMPSAVPATFEDLIQSRYDCRLVTVKAQVRSADVANYSLRNSRMQVLVDGAEVEATLDANDGESLKNMLDADVEITGVESGRFDGKMQLTGVMLHITSMANIKVLARAKNNPWSLPVTAMDQILSGYHPVNRTQRVRVQGTITYYQPGSAVVMQNGSKSLWIMTKSRNELRIGDVADATGIPDVHNGFLSLSHGEVRATGTLAPLQPLASTWTELTRSGHLFDLVSTRGKVVVGVREEAQDEYVLLAEGHIFSAVIRHPTSTYGSTAPPPLPPMKLLPAGSTVEVTGICVLEDSNPFDRNVPFDLMMRSYDDIAIVAWPSWMTVRNLARVISVMMLILLCVSAWGWTLKRKVQRQTAALASRAAAEAQAERRNARLQQQRSRILEDINGSRPLVEVLEEITELVSFQLSGAPCWCEVADGPRLGCYAADKDGLRIVAEPIVSRSGPPLGTICAAIDPRSPAAAQESETFFVGSQLAALAIENRRLYSDLVHRSEFDLLTDIHNRFSLDKYLDAAMAKAREDASIFGLIYVDLDEFKQVNDVYGHRAGDLYLQEVAARMKRQLRGADLLARVGGDEFAVLVPMVHCREDVEEVAARLEHSFAAPVQIEGYSLRGSASVGIALYPEDGSTKDSLMSAADAAMYVTKHVRQTGLESEDADTRTAVPQNEDRDAG
jgi:diguanylate cyclase (GGDEF)-like protein